MNAPRPSSHRYGNFSKSRLNPVSKDAITPQSRWKKTKWDVPDSPVLKPVPIDPEQFSFDQQPSSDASRAEYNKDDTVSVGDVVEVQYATSAKDDTSAEAGIYRVEKVKSSTAAETSPSDEVFAKETAMISSTLVGDPKEHSCESLPSAFSEDDTIVVYTKQAALRAPQIENEPTAKEASPENDEDTIVLRRSWPKEAANRFKAVQRDNRVKKSIRQAKKVRTHANTRG